MKFTGCKKSILVTTVPTEAKGGIVELHRTLYRQPEAQCFEFTLFPVASHTPNEERLPGRLVRVLLRIIKFSYLLVTDNSIKIVHINTSSDPKAILRDSSFILLSRVFGKKILLQIHSTIDTFYNLMGIEWIKRRVYSLCDKILIFSKVDMEKSKKIVPIGKVEIFPNAVNLNDYKKNGGFFRRDLSIPEDGKTVLFISRFFKAKGVFDLIDSIPAVVGKTDKVYFVFAGEGPERDRMIEACKIKNLDAVVRFPGNLDERDAIRAFSSADIFVLPSYSEGMPMAVLQALAAGLPVVVTPVGAIPDFIKDGVNGFFVEPRSPGQIAEKITMLLGDEPLRKRMGRVNIELAGKEFDAKVVSARLERLYAAL